jgi:hypothetical protein
MLHAEKAVKIRTQKQLINPLQKIKISCPRIAE